MIGIISKKDESQKVTKSDISFIHIIASFDYEIEKEVAPLALKFARDNNLEKVFLFYGKEKKIIYDYSN